MKPSRAIVEKLARERWGDDVEAFGHLNTVGVASNPYARDGAKEFHAIVRYKSNREILLNVTKPTASEAWAEIFVVVSSPALASAAHWDRLADEAEARAEYERKTGRIVLGVTGPHDHKAVLYRNTAKSLRLEHETGVAHCACHVVPNGRCPSNPRNRGRS